MPICFLEAPTGIHRDAKATLAASINAALDDTYHVGDVRLFFREYAAEDYAQDGRIQAEPIRPVLFLEVPELPMIDAKRKLAERLQAAIAKAYEGLAHVGEAMVLLNEYPLHDVFVAGRLQADNPEIVEMVRQMKAAAGSR
jgi:hypothetical protein